jgi:choline-sulfatase
MNQAMEKPHILFLFTDQQRADCLGCAGHPVLETPHMDRLAAEGTRFTHCCTTSPLCVPARISLATGLYPHNNNLWSGDNTIPVDADTYMHRLKRAGYRTCSIGKNHLQWMENCDLYANVAAYHAIGFDHIEDMSGTWGIIEGKSVYTDYLEKRDLLEPVRRYLKELEDKPDELRRYVAEPLPFPGAEDPAEHYIDAFIGRRVERYVDQYDGHQPSFVYAGFQGPHEPWDAPDRYADRYDLDRIPDPIPEKPDGDWLPDRSKAYHRFAQYYPPPTPQALKAITARYYGKIAQIDDAIDGILAAYDRKGWLDNTVIVFASDHGEMLGDLNRLSKSVFYESALRVPLIVRLPPDRQPQPGAVSEALVETIDIHATLLEAAGAEAWKHQDSRSVLPLVEGRVDSTRDDVLSEVHAHIMLRTGNRKLVVGRDGRTLQLFDLESDPLEQMNLCGHPEYREEEQILRSELLSRLVADTFRDSDIDPEYCEHTFPHSPG